MYHESQNKKRNMLPVIILFMLIMLLAGCGKDNGKESEAVSEETQTTSVAATDKEETEVGEEVTKMDFKELLASAGDSEPKFVIWNVDIQHGKILDNGEEYELSEGDKLIVYSPEEYKDNVILNNVKPSEAWISSVYGRCAEITWIKEYKARNDISVTVSDIGGKDYELKACLLNPNAPASGKTTFKNFDDWAATLTYDYPVAGIWNEAASQGQILEDEQEYEMTEGDCLVVYRSESCGEMQFGDSGVVKSMENIGKCTLINLNERETIPVYISIERLDIKGDYKYVFPLQCTLRFPGMEGKFTTIDEWIDELLETEKQPRIIVWNETIGTKQVLEDGEEYQLQEGDKMAVFWSENYWPLNVYGWDISVPDADSYEMASGYTSFILADKDRIDFRFPLAPNDLGPNDSANDLKVEVYATFVK